jgi:hypothetical protein
MSSGTRAQLAELEALPMAALQARWRSLLGSDPPRYNRGFLIRRLAHRLQELAYGGLSHAARARMEELLAQAGCDEMGRLAARPPTRGRREQPVAGTRLLREWNGEVHEVTAVAGGFAYRGRRYRSLSIIAAAITGTHWNGPAFFGLRQSKQAKEGAR